MLKNKNIVVGVTGGIAAYKACDVVSKLKRQGANVDVIMTKSALEFVGELTFRTLSNNFVITDMFEEPKTWEVEHISLAKKADMFLIVPATANFVGKVANGIADDMLTTTVMATKAPVYVALAMNTNMYENPIVQGNISRLRDIGYRFIDPASGVLACGDNGKGKLADPQDIVDTVVRYFCTNSESKYNEIVESEKVEDTLSINDEIVKSIDASLQSDILESKDFENAKKDLTDLRIIVTAGPTIEVIDPVRFLSNRSTGKMGYSIAQEAANRGAKVTLITGQTSIPKPEGLYKIIDIESAQDLYDAIIGEFDSNDIVIQSAAVADYRPAEYSNKKIKKSDGDMYIKLTRNKDVAKELGKIKNDKILVGFAAETNDLMKSAKKKIEKKNLDFIVANDLTKEGAGFGVDTNIVKIIDREGEVDSLPLMSKSELANIILDKVLALSNK